MNSMLPDLTPHDHHSLWYTSSRHPVQPPPAQNHHPNHENHDAPQGQGQAHNNRRNAHGGIERTALARLRGDEQYMERRRMNVSNFGSTWLKPPGVPKTLFQMREERREAEEHAESLRREQIAQELAEAEAEAAGATMDLDADEMMDEMEEVEEGMQDLDDDIPEGEGFGFDGEDSEDEDEENEVEEVEDFDDDDDEGHGPRVTDDVPPEVAQQREMRDQLRNLQATEDRVQELMVRGQGSEPDMFGGEDEIDEEDRAEMLEEEDLVHMSHEVDVQSGMDMDMDADLDGDIPEAEDDGGYEHTDSDASLSSHEESYAGPSRAPQPSRFRGSLPRSSLPSEQRRNLLRSSLQSNQRGSLAQSDIDISGLLSGDGSTFLDSSPQLRRRN